MEPAASDPPTLAANILVRERVSARQRSWQKDELKVTPTYPSVLLIAASRQAIGPALNIKWHNTTANVQLTKHKSPRRYCLQTIAVRSATGPL